MSKYSEVIKLLKQSTNVAVFMHINPDCDCIGSAIALATFLKKDGKKAVFFSPNLKTTDMIAEKYNFLPNFDLFNKGEEGNFDLAVAVDTGDVGRLGETGYKKFIKIKNSIVIDHHEIHEDFAKLTYRESGSASTTQILYKIMKEYNENLLDREIATLLYAGIVTDSGGFTFSNCSQETHIVGAELLSYGIDNARICDVLLKQVSYNVFNLRNKILSRARFFEEGRIGIIVFHANDFADTHTTDADTSGIYDFVRDIDTVDIAISIAEIGDKKYKVSFRTSENANAAACAKCFGGGGHIRAAGCRVYGYFEEVYEKILSVAREMLNNND